MLPMPMGEPGHVSGPRKWLRSATSIFTMGKNQSGVHPVVPRSDSQPALAPAAPGGRRKFDAPVPLSEFASRGKSNAHTHTGHGRRDALSSGERTRILRMLRDEGGRMADEDSQVFMGAPPSKNYDFDFDDDAAPPPPPPLRPDVPAKPAVMVGLAQARRQKRPGSAAPPPPPGAGTKGPQRKAPARPRAPLPKPFEETTRAVSDAELLAQVREAPGPGRVPPRAVFDDQPTRMGNVDARLLDENAIDEGLNTLVGNDAMPPKFLNTATIPEHVVTNRFDELGNDEATRLSHIDNIQGRPPRAGDDRTRNVDIRQDRAMSDVDWTSTE